MMVAAWKKLAETRALWAKEEYGKALGNYRTLFALEKINPRLPILAELSKDTVAINKLGAEVIAKAAALRAAGDLEGAKATLKKTVTSFDGFTPADEARALYKEIVEQQKRPAAPPAATPATEN